MAVQVMLLVGLEVAEGEELTRLMSFDEVMLVAGAVGRTLDSSPRLAGLSSLQGGIQRSFPPFWGYFRAVIGIVAIGWWVF